MDGMTDIEGSMDEFMRTQDLQERRVETNISRGEVFKRVKFTENPEVVQFFPGDYGPNHDKFFSFYRAWVPDPKRPGKWQYVNCSCFDGRDKVPCVLHHLYREERKKYRNDTKHQYIYRPTPVHAFNLFRLSYFHKVEYAEEIGRGGDVITKTRQELCTDKREIVDPESTRCGQCAQGNTNRRYGQRCYLPAGMGFYNSIMDIAHQVSLVCKHCGGELQTVKFVCPLCWRNSTETILLDPRRPGNLTAEEIVRFWKTKTICRECGEAIRPKEIVRCLECSEKPIMGRDIWHTPLRIKKIGSEKSTALAHEGDLLKPIEYPEDIQNEVFNKPFDFPKMFSVTADEQAEALGIPNPFKSRNQPLVEGSDDPEAIPF
jgi:hypothetical protein